MKGLNGDNQSTNILEVKNKGIKIKKTYLKNHNIGEKRWEYLIIKKKYQRKTRQKNN